MLYPITNKPQEFSHLVNECLWFRLANEKGTYAYLGVDVGKAVAAVHIQVVRWSATVLKTLKKDWEEFVAVCRSHGIKRLVVSNKSDDSEKWSKFIQLFFFPKPDCVLVSTQEI